MKISKSALLDPARNEAYGVAAIALSLFVFAYSARFGQISILAYYGVWFLLVLVDYRRALGNYLKYLWIFSFALFAFVSTFWSPAFSISLRTGIQYLTHVICALIAMRAISAPTLVRGAMVGVIVVLIYSHVFGTYLPDAIDGTFGFVGAFESKNQLGFYASLGIYFSYAAVMIFGERRLWLPVAGMASLISAYSLYLAQSATSVITTLAIVAGCIGLQGFMIFSPRHRRLFFSAAVVLGIGAVVGAMQVGAADAVLGVFGKDTTLTGRTYLWQQGFLQIAERPLLGIGYQGFWVQGFPEAERLWDYFGIAGRSGFHFHNTYIEAMVETGVIGMVLLALILLTTLFGHLRRLLTIARTPESLLLFGIMALLLVRSFVEIDIMNPYQVGSFLFYFAAGRLAVAQRRQVRARFGRMSPDRTGMQAS
jgi:exopolysaccharide production protein ExoQ